MPKFYPTIPDNLHSWLLAQPLFWTATAPKHGSHINVSPKGTYTSLLTLHSSSSVSYLDLTGSGCETISHIYDNGRITLLFCSFSTSPRIVRLFGRGRVIENGEPGWEAAFASLSTGITASEQGEKKDSYKFSPQRFIAARAIITISIDLCQTSCGYGVPIILNTPDSDGIEKEAEGGFVPTVAELNEENFQLGRCEGVPGMAHRPTMVMWGTKTVEQGKMREYLKINNFRSLDGLPGLRGVRRRELGVWGMWWSDWGVGVRRWREAILGLLIGLMVGVVMGAWAVAREWKGF